MAFCPSCDREVGVEKTRAWMPIIVFLALGLVTPLWPVTLPMFWFIAFVVFLGSGKKVCGICKTKLM